MNASLLNLAFDVAAPTCAIVCIFEGVRRISVFGLSKNATLSAVFGFVYVIGYATFSYSAHNLQLRAAAMLHKGIAIPEQAADWGAHFSPIKKSEISIHIARVAFSEHGQLRYYFDEAGKRLLLAPSQADIDKREIRVAQLAQLDYAAQESSDTSAAWLLTSLAAASFGFVWSRGDTANT